MSIGFQGSDPITDFRGGGLLSLSQLIYFCENYTERARNLNVRASHPTKGYGLAITGINLTVMLSKALNAGAMKKVSTRKIIEFHFLVFLQYDNLRRAAQYRLFGMSSVL